MKRLRIVNFARVVWHKLRYALRPVAGPDLLWTLERHKIKKPRKILHIGANTGGEARYYSENGMIAWHVEAIPSVFKVLCETCHKFDGQYAVHACLSELPGQRLQFNISSNAGLSSSLFALGRHQEAYPDICYTESIILTTSTVDQLIADGEIPPDIDFLVIDAQGAELLILQGARRLLESGVLNGAMIETAVQPLYENGAGYIDVSVLMQKFNLHLCEAVFNDRGWCDAIYSTKYWP
jgi:FkbM family methyltransferase